MTLSSHGVYPKIVFSKGSPFVIFDALRAFAVRLVSCSEVRQRRSFTTAAHTTTHLPYFKWYTRSCQHGFEVSSWSPPEPTRSALHFPDDAQLHHCWTKCFRSRTACPGSNNGWYTLLEFETLDIDFSRKQKLVPVLLQVKPSVIPLVCSR